MTFEPNRVPSPGWKCAELKPQITLLFAESPCRKEEVRKRGSCLQIIQYVNEHKMFILYT